MKSYLKPILLAIAVGITLTACNFGNDSGETTQTVTYTSDDLLMRLDDGTNVTMPEAPQLQIVFKYTTEGTTISFAFVNLRLKSRNETFNIPEMNLNFTETGMNARQLIVPSTGSVNVENFYFTVTGNWMTISMDVNTESVRLCSSWIWTGQQLYNANYDIDVNKVKKGGVILFGGKSYINNSAAGTNVENENIEYGITFNPTDNTANVYSFFTSIDGTNTVTKTYLFEEIPYIMTPGGISIDAKDPFIAKIVTKTESAEDPQLNVSSLSVFIPYSALNSYINYTITNDRVNISCPEMELINELIMH